MMLRLIAAALALFALGNTAWSAEPAEAQKAFFQNEIAPILVGTCLECHAADGKGGLDLRSRDAALAGGESGDSLVPGSPDESLIYEHVSAGEMPPDNPLDKSQVAAIQQWIADGAYYPEQPLDLYSISTDLRAGYDWWSLQPLAAVSPPQDEDAPPDWQASDIDRFVWAKLREKNLSPSAPATPHALIRRVIYDMTGLPPTPAELTAFLDACAKETGKRNQVGDAAYAALIDRLLASPHYGEHWGRHWLDVVRFGESRGFERNQIVDNAWPFRDYVIRSLNDDKPFDRFFREHLAGDALGAGDPEVEVGTAFLVCGPYDDVGNQDAVQAAQIRANTVDEMIRATGEAFLGMTIGCGRCHDHKFDPIAQTDYYRLYATLVGVRHGNREILDADTRETRDAERKRLADKKIDLFNQKEEWKQAMIERANAKLNEIEAAWTRPPVARQYTEEKFAPVEARFVRLISEGSDINPSGPTNHRIEEFEVWSASDADRNVALAAHGGKARGKSRRPTDFSGAYVAALAIDGIFGAHWVAEEPTLTIELPQVETINRVSFSSDRGNQRLNHHSAAITCEYRVEVSVDGDAWAEVANSYDRQPINAKHREKRLRDAVMTPEDKQRISEIFNQIYAVDDEVRALPSVPNWSVGQFSQPEGATHVFLGGSPQRKGDAVVPASLAVLSSATDGYELAADASEQDRRLALARWITADDNPLTPRVLANRVWHYHFGTGIVSTPNDLGFMGDRPSHPELLDWLASKLKQHDWRLKPLHREILLSQTYRQASTYDEAAAKIDGDSRLLWRYPPRRLTGEEIRDTMLSVSGKLDPKMGGHGFRLYTYLQDNVSTYVPRDEHGEDTFRRAVYHQNARATQIDLMSEFDSPDCAFSIARRTSTTTPLQALTLLNHSFTMEMSKFFAERLENEAGASNVGRQIDEAFLLSFGRLPKTSERRAAATLIAAHGLRAFCRAMLNSNELIYLD